jgi:nicotinamidase-related amidase
MATAVAKPGKSLLSPTDHTLILIDYQSQMAFATRSIDAVMLRNNSALVIKAARIFGVSTILTTVAEKTFSGPMFDEIKREFPDAQVIDRTSMNTWEDERIARRVNQIGKSRLVFGGLWTSVCIVGPTLSALDQGFEVYVIADACGDVSEEAYERAMERMVQLGVRPMTSLQYLLAPAAAALADTSVGGTGMDATTADLILRNGKMTTLDRGKPQARAFAVAGGRIAAVGEDDEVMKLAGATTQIVELNGRRVIPGLIDSHVHVIRGGLNYNLELRWDGIDSLAEAMRRLKEQVARTPPPQWVRVVGGFTEHQFAEKRLPTLDGSTRRPRTRRCSSCTSTTAHCSTVRRCAQWAITAIRPIPPAAGSSGIPGVSLLGSCSPSPTR